MKPETSYRELLEQSAEDLYEHAPCGYLATLPDGTIAQVNQTFARWTGYRPEDLVGRRRFQDLLTAGGRIYHETHYAPLLAMQGAVREIALEVVCADGRRLAVLVNSDLKRDPAGTPSLVRTTVFDARDRREYERELVRARDRERAARERTERLARITNVLAGALNRDAMAAAIVDELTRGVAADRAALAMLDADTGRLDVVASHGREAADLDGWRGADAEAALRSQTPCFHEAPARALAILPLVVEARSTGVLLLAFEAAPRLSDEDRALMVAAASQCAQALERVRLHEQTERAAQRSAFLAETSSALDESPEFAVRAQRLAALAADRIADGARVEIAEGGVRTAVAAAGHAPVAGEPTLEQAVATAIATGAPHLVPAGEEPMPLSVAALPLRARGRVLGALALWSFRPERAFRPVDLTFLGDLADRAALALENARLYEQERTVAQTLQHSLLAGDPPADPRFQVATRYRPAVATLEVGGDWHDTFRIGDGTIGIVVGDVVGRGVEAASAMGQLRSAIRALAATRLGPALLIERLDAFVEQVPSARWATLAYAEIELETGLTRFSCAGHPPPVIAQPAASPRLLWDGRSTPLGALPGLPARSEGAVTLQPGARLLLYTDGLFERRDRPLDAGLDRLVEEFGSRRDAPLATLIEELTEAMLADERGQDDVCVLCLAFDPSSGPPRRTRARHAIAHSG